MTRFAELRRKVLTVERLDFYSVDLRQWTAPRLPRMRLKVRFGVGGEEDIRRMAADERLDVGGRCNFYLKKLHLGHRLILGTMGDDVLFYLWVVSGEKILIDKILILEPGEIAVERAFTRKDVRGHGLFVYALDHLIAAEKAAGATCCLTEIARNNKPMVSNLAKCGFQRLDSSYYWIAHPFGQHALVLGPLRRRCRPNTVLAPRAGFLSRSG